MFISFISLYVYRVILSRAFNFQLCKWSIQIKQFCERRERKGMEHELKGNGKIKMIFQLKCDCSIKPILQRLTKTNNTQLYSKILSPCHILIMNFVIFSAPKNENNWRIIHSICEWNSYSTISEKTKLCHRIEMCQLIDCQHRNWSTIRLVFIEWVNLPLYIRLFFFACVPYSRIIFGLI